MIELLYAQIITNTLIGNISDSAMLTIIIIGLFVFTIIIASMVGYFVAQDVRLKSVRNASILSLASLILFLFVISNVTLFIYYRDIYRNIYAFDILWVFPQVLVYFSIYILNDVFNLFILTIVMYYVFFVIFLDKLYIKRRSV